LETFKVQDIPSILVNLACNFTRLVLIFIVFWIAYSGVKFFLARDNPVVYGEAKKSLFWSIVGMILVFGVYTVIVSIANFLGYSNLSFVPLVCS